MIMIRSGECELRSETAAVQRQARMDSGQAVLTPVTAEALLCPICAQLQESRRAVTVLAAWLAVWPAVPRRPTRRRRRRPARRSRCPTAWRCSDVHTATDRRR